MSRDFEDDRPKRSWRDIDRNKDKSKHRREDRERMAPFKQARAESASKVYKSKLDAFFEGEGKAPAHVKEKLGALAENSKEGKERSAALKAIREAGTSSAADKAVAKYLEKWDLPYDFEILSQVLTCSDEDYIAMALEALETMLDDNRAPRRTQLLEQRLKRVKTLAEEPELGEKATELIKALRVFS